MPNDDQAPATKADIAMIMDEIGKLYDANERWKSEILDRVSETTEKAKEDTKRHFDLTVEAIRHDLLGANRDTIEQDEDRITRIETHLGMGAA